MAYTNDWDDIEATPTTASSLETDNPEEIFRRNAVAIRERLCDILGIDAADFDVDPLAPLILKMSRAAATKILAGSTSLTVRNSADSADILAFLVGIGVDVTGQGRSIQYDAGNSGAALTVNFNNGNNQKITLTGNVTFTFSNPRAGASYLLHVIQDGTGGRTMSFPATVRWPGGSAPTFITTAARVSLIGLFWTGSVYLATLIGTNYNVS